MSKAQMITRTKTSDKLTKINGMFVDGTDPRFASYLSMANTSSPRGQHNTEACEVDAGKEVFFTTTRAIKKGKHILWTYHSIFDDPDSLADFADQHPATSKSKIKRKNPAP